MRPSNHRNYNNLMDVDDGEPENTLADYIRRNSPHAEVEHPIKAKEPKRMGAVDFLENGIQLLTQRGEQRDSSSGERSMRRAVRAFWTLYGDRILDRGSMLESEGWEFMCILKKSRKAYGVYTRDDYEDDVSYAALAGEAAEKDS